MMADKKQVTRLLKTARGQIDGILKMVEEDRYCIDISHQIMASEAILKRANKEVLKAHMTHCYYAYRLLLRIFKVHILNIIKIIPIAKSNSFLLIFIYPFLHFINNIVYLSANYKFYTELLHLLSLLVVYCFLHIQESQTMSFVDFLRMAYLMEPYLSTHPFAIYSS